MMETAIHTGLSGSHSSAQKVRRYKMDITVDLDIDIELFNKQITWLYKQQGKEAEALIEVCEEIREQYEEHLAGL